MAKITTDDLAHIGELLAVKFDERSAAVTPEQLSSLLASFNVVQSAPTTPPPTLPPKVDIAARIAILEGIDISPFHNGRHISPYSLKNKVNEINNDDDFGSLAEREEELEDEL